MTPEQNKAAVVDMLDRVFNQGNPAAFLDLLAPDCTFRVAGYREPFHGNQEVVRWVTTYLDAFDRTVTIEEAAVEGENVMVRWIMHAYHKGEYLGMPATGTHFSWMALQWSQFRGEKVQNVWIMLDTLTMTQDLGFLPKGGLPPPLARFLAWRQRRKNGSAKT